MPCFLQIVNLSKLKSVDYTDVENKILIIVYKSEKKYYINSSSRLQTKKRDKPKNIQFYTYWKENDK